jgi:hypothetical protein
MGFRPRPIRLNDLAWYSLIAFSLGYWGAEKPVLGLYGSGAGPFSVPSNQYSGWDGVRNGR